MPFGLRRHRGGVGCVVAVAVALAPAAPAAASCQTVYCQQQYNRSDLAREVELVARVAAEPGDVEGWRELLRLLEHKPRRVAFLARYDALHDWEPQSDLEVDPTARLRGEREAWLLAWKTALPESGEPWCEQARWEVEPAARVEVLRRGADLLPDDPRVRSCLAEALAAVGQPAEALAAMEELRDRRPDDLEVWDELVASLRKAGGPEALRAALEERARRFPDDRDARRELLAFYDEQGLATPRDQLLAEITDDGDLETRWLACVALSLRTSADLRARCEAALVADFGVNAGGLSDHEMAILASSRNGVLMHAIHRRDWEGLRQLLAQWPPERLLDAWVPLADWLADEGGCAGLLAAWRDGQLAAVLAGEKAQAEATRLGWSLRRCGHSEAADAVVRPFVEGAGDRDLAWMGGESAQDELRARTREVAADPNALRLLDDTQAGAPLAERLPDLLRWATAAPADPEPARRLATAFAAAGRGAEAVQWLAEAADRDPGNPDLRLDTGALALRFRDHSAAETAARHVLAAPATPRQHAEAHYLLGRVALREGRREDAATALLRYFPLRLRYAGCCGADACDRGLQLLLLGNHDLTRLRGYLRDREAAVDWFTGHMTPEGNAWALPCLREPPPPPVEPALVAECATAGARAYVAGAAAARPADGELQRRLRALGSAPACTPEPPPDLDALFDDATLLGLAGKLTATN